jgi:Uncharacterized protein conserved in bacteria
MRNIENANNLGAAVKYARKKKGMTQTQLSERLSITTRYLKGIENSGRKPSYSLLIRILNELELLPNAIL